MFREGNEEICRPQLAEIPMLVFIVIGVIGVIGLVGAFARDALNIFDTQSSGWLACIARPIESYQLSHKIRRYS